MAEKEMIRIEVIKNPSGTYSWKYVKLYDTKKELENEVRDLFGAAGFTCEIEIGGKIFKL